VQILVTFHGGLSRIWLNFLEPSFSVRWLGSFYSFLSIPNYLLDAVRTSGSGTNAVHSGAERALLSAAYPWSRDCSQAGVISCVRSSAPRYGAPSGRSPRHQAVPSALRSQQLEPLAQGARVSSVPVSLLLSRSSTRRRADPPLTRSPSPLPPFAQGDPCWAPVLGHRPFSFSSFLCWESDSWGTGITGVHRTSIRAVHCQHQAVPFRMSGACVCLLSHPEIPAEFLVCGFLISGLDFCFSCGLHV
jgi:hypothetical protein